MTHIAPGLRVRRMLPAPQRRTVGPFVFFDEFGPATLAPEVDSDVAGHPHIGLATVTYLFEGRQMHRDSIGSVQLIEPGAVNWMTAGRGIVHSERAHEADRGRSRATHGLQLWVALPPALEDCEPAFQHVPATDIPAFDAAPGVRVRVLVGKAWDRTSPVHTASETLYLDITLAANARFTLPRLAPEQAVYGVGQGHSLDGQAVAASEMVVLASGQGAELSAGPEGARLVVIGGAPLEQPVRMWWNFVSARRERLAQAADDWLQHRFAPIPGETDRIEAPPWRD
jgi:redox-sensitive bicupin YhaK (pirin superfamily)